MKWTLILVLACSLWGQQTGRGKSSISAPFDPLKPAPPLVIHRAKQPSLWPTRLRSWFGAPHRAAGPPRRGPDEPGFYRKHTVVPLAEYIRRKDELRANAPPFTGPPGNENVYLVPRRAPGDLAASLANNPVFLFEGPSQTGGIAPADTDMAVGPADIIAVVNSRVVRFSRDPAPTNDQTLYEWFQNLVPTVCASGFGVCNFYDPTIRYDALHGRFILSAIGEDPNTLKTWYVISVSNGATYASGWKNWALEGSRNGATQTALEIDFPQVGYDNNAVYIAVDMLGVSSELLQYAKIRILKKSELYNPNTTTLTFQDIWDLKNEDGSTVYSVRPVILRGAPGTGTPPAVFVNASIKINTDYLTLWRIQSPTSATPVANRTTLSNLLRYDFPARFPQLGSRELLDSGDSRVLKAIQRGSVVYTARGTGYPTIPTTVTFDRVDLGTNTVTLQQRLTGGNYFYPAFDVPASHGSENAIPSKLVVGSATDAAGALTFAGVPQVKAGMDGYEFGTLRWGDYSGGAIDPVLGGLWVFGEYARPKAGTTGRWGTAGGYYPVSTAAQFTDVTAASPFFDFINVLKQWSITSGCTATTYCPATNVTRGQMAVFVVRSITGDDFVFPPTPFFNDVPSAHPFFKYIQKLRDLGITTGCTANTFCPDNNVTRGEMAVFLVRGKLSSLHQDNFPFPQPAYFTDVPSTNVFFKFVQKLRELGITSGCSATAYCPGDAVTRDQMATFLVRGFLN